MKRLGTALLLTSLLLLTGCGDQLPMWMGGKAPTIKRAPGDRTDVIYNHSMLTPDSEVAEVAVETPEQANIPSWPNRNTAMLTNHIGVTGISHEDTARIGGGNAFSRPVAASPVVADGIVVAIDAAGIVSAHDESHIDHVLWTNRDGLEKDVEDVLGGGVALADGVVYATTGNGGVRALALTTGQLQWAINVGAPIHGAAAVGNGIVAVLTADNQTIAVDAKTGVTRWSHRGIHEAASYYSTTSPVISDGVVISAYSSGEVFALQPETGSVLWTDTLGSTIKTRAAAVFNGIDADPMVQEGVVVVVSAAGELQASAVKNGQPLWQKRIGAHMTPWPAGNALFVLTDTHDVAAVFKRDGAIRWSKSLAVADPRDATHDLTPALYGPILAGNAVLVLDGNGVLSAFKPQTGERINSYDLAGGVVTPPIITNGAMYYITRDAVLHRYY